MFVLPSLRETEQKAKQVVLFMGSGIECFLHSSASPPSVSWCRGKLVSFPCLAQVAASPLCGGLSAAANLAEVSFVALKRCKN